MTHSILDASLTDKPLYGGAIEMKIPHYFLDASDIRQIPDNQEVFVDMASDCSLIVELLEMHSSPSVTESAEHHFWQLASDNDASNESELSSTKAIQLPHGGTGAISVGTQKISKFNERGEDAKNLVLVYLVLIRLEDHETDALITLNQTMQAGAQSSSHSSRTGVAPANVISENQFVIMAQSFHVRDVSLFS